MKLSVRRFGFFGCDLPLDFAQGFKGVLDSAVLHVKQAGAEVGEELGLVVGEVGGVGRGWVVLHERAIRFFDTPSASLGSPLPVRRLCSTTIYPMCSANNVVQSYDMKRRVEGLA